MVLDNSVSEMTAFLTINDNRPDGFTVTPAAIPGVEFNPFTHNAMIEAGITPNTAIKPIPNGFFLLQQDYVEYLAALRKAGFEHPANKTGLPWGGESTFVFEMPSLEDATDAQIKDKNNG